MMKQRLISSSICFFILSLGLLFLPPGLSWRLSGMARWLSQPSLSWADLSLRVSHAALGDGTQSPSQQNYVNIQQELADTQTALNSAWSQYNSALQENRLFKQQLRLADESAAFTTTLCKVIRRDPIASYYDSLLINRGSKDGIQPGQLALSFPQKGTDDATTPPPALIGIVKDVSNDTAVISLITSKDFIIACRIPARNITGIITGRSDSPSTIAPQILMPPCNLTLNHPYGEQTDTVQAGDFVFTNALGANNECIDHVLIGTVDQLGRNELGAPQFQIRPAVFPHQLSYVLIALKASHTP